MRDGWPAIKRPEPRSGWSHQVPTDHAS
jgi:hypothetical protein